MDHAGQKVGRLTLWCGNQTVKKEGAFAKSFPCVNALVTLVYTSAVGEIGRSVH
jgi:hypothetical protein